MNEDLKQDFCTHMYPAYILEKITGLAAFTIQGAPGKRILMKINNARIYKAIICVAVSVIIIVLNDFLSPSDQKNIIRWYIAVYDIHIDIALLWSIVISTHAQAELIKKAWYDVITNDCKLCNLGFEVRTYMHYYSVFWIVFMITINITAHAVSTNNVMSHQQLEFSLISNIIFTFVNLYQISLEISFQVWMLNLSSRFSILNQYIQREASLVSVEVLQEITKLHQNLCHITKNINIVYSPALSINLSLIFFTLTYQVLYDVLLPMRKNEFCLEDMFKTGLWLVYSLSNFAAIIVAGETIIKQVSKLL